VKFSENRLCPGLTSRENYLNWLSGILNVSDSADTRVLDIGCGASCIYPLLGFRKYGWSFLASDIDDLSLRLAEENLRRNPEAIPKIELIKIDRSYSLQTFLSSYFQQFESQQFDHILDCLVTLPDYSPEQFRGPIRRAVNEDGRISESNHLAKKVESFCSLSDKMIQKFGPSESFFTAVMCNPPFYDLHEEVIIIMLCFYIIASLFSTSFIRYL
jgi:23S rRNA A1618 N6-methylase RlmF